MEKNNFLKNYYIEYCAKYNYYPNQYNYNIFHSYMLPLYKELICEERESAKRQGISDPELEGKTDSEIIKDRLKGKAKSPSQEILPCLQNEILYSAKLLNFNFPFPFYCGDFPELSFNAKVKKTKHGALILIYDELCTFVYNLLKVFTLSVPIMAHSSFDENEDNQKLVQPILTPEESAKKVVILIENYFNKGSSGAPPFPAQAAAISETCISLSLSTIRFAIAHECGHILGGHLSENDLSSTYTPLQSDLLKKIKSLKKKEFKSFFSDAYTVEDAMDLAKKWDQEKQADQYGMDLCLAPYWPLNGSLERFHNASVRLSGPLIFFTIDEVLNDIIKNSLHLDKKELLNFSHPPSFQREKVMKSWIKQISVNADKLISQASLFKKWMYGIHDKVYNQL